METIKTTAHTIQLVMKTLARTMSGSCPLNIIPSYPINTINCAKQQKKLTP